MAHGLLISDHPLVNDLYSFNLKAYVDLGLTVKDNLDDALKIIELGAHGDIIIALSQVGGEDAGRHVLDLLDQLKIEVPFILVGEKSTAAQSSRIHTLPANLNIPLMVKKCAELLGVTAQDMADKVVPDFYPVPMSILEAFTKSPCDIYAKVGVTGQSSDFSKILGEGHPLATKIPGYKTSGINQLFIPSELRLKIVNQASSLISSQLDNPNLEEGERIKVTEQGYEIVAGLLGEAEEVTPEVVEISKKCVESVKKVIKDVPKLKSLLVSLLENKTGYLYLHSVMGTYVAKHIVKEISWGSEEHAEKLAFVFFFHDIFLSPVFARHPELQFEEDMVFNESLIDKEKEVVINHGRLAAEMVKTFPRCPMGADAIILQHHGTTNGMGFALEFKDDISPLAKVLIISEAFVEELIKEKNKGAIPPNVDSIIERLRDRFTKHTYKKIINCLETISF